MKKQIHLLKTAGDSRAVSVIESLSKLHPDKLTVILLQEGRNTPPTWTARTYLLAGPEEKWDNLQTGVELIGHGRLVDLIFEAETVISW